MRTMTIREHAFMCHEGFESMTDILAQVSSTTVVHVDIACTVISPYIH